MIIILLSPLRARKSAIVGRTITLERKPSKRRKELIPKRMQRGLRVITLQVAIKMND